MATALAVTFDALTWQGGGDVFTKAVVKPLTALGLLWLMITIPRLLMRVASLGAATPSGGAIGRVAGVMGGRFAQQAISRHVPEEFGGTREWAQEQTKGRQDSAAGGSGGGAAPADAGGAKQAARAALGVGAVAATGGVGAAAAGASAGAGTASGQAGAATAGGQAGSATANGAGTDTAAGTAAGARGGAALTEQGGVKGWRNAAGTFHDARSNLPSNPGTQLIERARGDVAELAAEAKSQSPDQREFAGHGALNQLADAGYAGSVTAYTQDHSPRQVGDRMADASTADGLSEETSGAFMTWGALDADTRQTVMEERDLAGRTAAGPEPSGATTPHQEILDAPGPNGDGPDRGGAT
jgi:hypothetical protein